MNSDTHLRRTQGCTPYDPEELARFRMTLVALRKDVSRSFEELTEAARRTIGESLGDLAAVARDPADRAAEASEHSMALVFLARAEREIRDIDDALERIENRSFGLCEGCSGPIPSARLTAIPVARHCIRCKRARER